MILNSYIEILNQKLNTLALIARCNHYFSPRRILFWSDLVGKEFVTKRIYPCEYCPLTWEIECVE